MAGLVAQTYRNAIAESIAGLMAEDERVLVLGEGVTDPLGIFGTTLPVKAVFPNRVIETHNPVAVTTAIVLNDTAPRHVRLPS